MADVIETTETTEETVEETQEVTETTETEVTEDVSETVEEQDDEITEDEETPESADDVSVWKRESRKWERLTKRETAEKEKAQKRAEAAERQLALMKAQEDRTNLVCDIAKEKGVSVSLLSRMTGDDEQSIRENADFLLENVVKKKGYQKLPDAGEPTHRVNQTSVEDILNIKNSRERLQAISQNLELF